MAKTNIDYADETSNPLFARLKGDETSKIGTFCEKPDPDGTCRSCWAETLNLRFGNKLAYDKVNRDNIEWLPREKEMERLVRLNARKPESQKFPGHPLVVFTNDTYDLFQPSISDKQRDWVFEIYDELTDLNLLVQSTYVSRMATYLRRRYPVQMPKQIIIGMSAGTQKFLDDNAGHLTSIRAQRDYVIFEPLLERVEIEPYLQYPPFHENYKMTFGWEDARGISLCIIGCESGPKRRPMKLEWAESIVEQCLEAEVAVFVKQLPINGKVEHDIAKFPPSLRYRQFPEVNQ